MALFLKDPDAALDYSVDWAAGYLDSQSIAASQWSVVPNEAGGISLSMATFGAGRTAATLAGGLPGHVYRITNMVTLSDARSDERSLTIRVEHR